MGRGGDALLREVAIPNVRLGFKRYLVGAAWWTTACELDLSFPAPPQTPHEDGLGLDTCEDDWWVPGQWVGRPIRGADDPFAALFAVWRRGYALNAVDEDEIVLTASEV